MMRIAIVSACLLCESGAFAAGPQSPALGRLDSSAPETADTAQDTPETLAGRHGVLKHNGWYVGPSIGSTMVNGNIAFNAGVKSAWLANRAYGLGLAAYGFGWDGSTQDNPTLRSDRRLNGGYGGALFQYIFRPNHLVHGLFDVTVGGGFVCTRLNANNDNRCEGGRGFFMIEPTAGFELNLTDFMRAGMTGGYRFTAAEERDGVSGSDLGGVVALANVAFGQF